MAMRAVSRARAPFRRDVTFPSVSGMAKESQDSLAPILPDKEYSTISYQLQPNSPGPQPVIDFEDPERIFAAKSAYQLLKSCSVLSSCRVQPLVQNSRRILDGAKSVLGSHLTNKILEKTFYEHFCLGPDEASRAPRIAALMQMGIMPILNYAAEDDVSGSEARNEQADEATRDINAARGIDCILTGNDSSHKAFIALKISGLGDPNTLATMTTILNQTGSNLDRGHSSSTLDELMASKLEKTDLDRYRRMSARLHHIAQTLAAKGDARVLFDAEPTNFQPAIDALVMSLQQKYNKQEPLIMNTYQCYLKDSDLRIEADMRRSQREGWHWGAKIVRGAYIHQERESAIAEGRLSPTHDTMEATHSNYNECVREALGRVACGGPELMVATHNQQSIESALDSMQRLKIAPENPGSGVYFGQLLGMADNLTLPLGAHGYNAYKMCAFGEVDLCVNFLIRRAMENSDALGGCEKEIRLARSALIGRLWPFGRREKRSSRWDQPQIFA